VLRWEEGLDAIRDTRRRPQIPTSAVVRAMAVMFLSRLGSLNALEQSRPSRFWSRWLGTRMPSADTVGRVGNLVQAEHLRSLLHDLYSRLKRMKALAPPGHGLMAAILDGHESHATFRRCCPACLERTIHTRDGDHVQYYHRHVALQLVGRDASVILSCTGWDIEGFTSWPQVTQPVRIVRSLEKRSVRRQLDHQVEELSSDWAWVTTLSKPRASTAAVTQLGHGRWTIENQGFNELVNRWYADHVYKHQPNAMLVFWLMAVACLNLFLAFYRRDLKPAARQAASMLQIARRIAAELFAAIPAGPARAPT